VPIVARDGDDTTHPAAGDVVAVDKAQENKHDAAETEAAIFFLSTRCCRHRWIEVAARDFLVNKGDFSYFVQQ